MLHNTESKAFLRISRRNSCRECLWVIHLLDTSKWAINKLVTLPTPTPRCTKTPVSLINLAPALCGDHLWAASGSELSGTNVDVKYLSLMDVRIWDGAQLRHFSSKNPAVTSPAPVPWLLPYLIMWQCIAPALGPPGGHGMCLGFLTRVHTPWGWTV